MFCCVHHDSHYIFLQVDVIHVNATAKNAADDKLRQSIHRYAHTHQAPASVILITGLTHIPPFNDRLVKAVKM